MCVLAPEATSHAVVVPTASLRSRVIWDVRWAGSFLLLLFIASAVGKALGYEERSSDPWQALTEFWFSRRIVYWASLSLSLLLAPSLLLYLFLVFNQTHLWSPFQGAVLTWSPPQRNHSRRWKETRARTIVPEPLRSAVSSRAVLSARSLGSMFFPL